MRIILFEANQISVRDVATCKTHASQYRLLYHNRIIISAFGKCPFSKGIHLNTLGCMLILLWFVFYYSFCVLNTLWFGNYLVSIETKTNWMQKPFTAKSVYVPFWRLMLGYWHKSITYSLMSSFWLHTCIHEQRHTHEYLMIIAVTFHTSCDSSSINPHSSWLRFVVFKTFHLHWFTNLELDVLHYKIFIYIYVCVSYCQWYSGYSVKMQTPHNLWVKIKSSIFACISCELL